MSEPVQKPAGSIFSPLARAVMDAFSEGLVVFDHEGRMIYANQPAREAAREVVESAARAEDVLPELARLGSRLVPLRVGKLTVGEAAIIPGPASAETLAERERRAILDTLDATGWRLAETASRLGISRTTLWRRLRAYRIDQAGKREAS